MPLHTLQPAASYTPKMGKKALSLLASAVDTSAPEAAQIEAVRLAWKAAVTDHARNGVAKAIKGHLDAVFEEHEMLYGDRPKEGDDGIADLAQAQVAYDSDADDAVTAAFDEAFQHGVGVGGWAEHTIDTRIDTDAGRNDLAQKFAGEIIANGQWLALSDDEARKILADNPRKPNTLSNDSPLADIHQPVIGTAEHPQTGISYESAWQTGVKLVREALARGTHDVLSIGDELELCIDSDDILGTAGAQRLAPEATPEIVRACMQVLAGRPAGDGAAWTETLVMAALEDAPAEQTYFQRTGELEPGTLGGAEMPGLDDDEPAAPKVNKGLTGIPRKTPAEQTADGAAAHEVMMRLLSLAGMPEQAMADILGVSRGMVNAAVKNRKNIDWSPDRVAKLKQASMEFATNVATFHDEAGAL